MNPVPDSEKTKEQLIAEIEALRAQVSILQQVKEQAVELSKGNELLRVEIAEHQRVEERLRLVESAVVNANDAIVITETQPIDEPGPRILYANPAFTRMTGYSLEEVLGKTPRILQGPKTDRTALDKIRTALKQSQPVEVELINYRKDGSEFWVELSIVPVTDSTGWNTRWIAIQRDITSRKRTEEELRTSEERFRLLVASIKDYAIFMLDVHGCVFSWNAGAERIKGYRAEEIIGQHFSVFYSPEDIERGKPQQGLEVAAAVGRCEDEGVRLRKDGSQFWANVVITALRDEGGNLRGFAKVTRDITERKQAQEVLRQSEELFRSLSACSPVGIFLTDVEGRCTYTNPRYQAIYGLTLRESLGEGWLESVHPEDREWVQSKWVAYSREGREYSEEFRLQIQEGIVRWVHVRSSPMYSFRGKLIGHVGTVEDITDRKQAEEALLISDVALQQMPDAIVLTDLQGNIQRWMGKAEQIFGYTAQEAIGKPVNFLHRPDIKERMTAEIIQSIQDTGVFCGEIPCVRKDGSQVPIETTAKTVYDKTGQPLFFVGINRDISDRKRAEAERTQLIREQAARMEAEAAQQRSIFLAQVSTVLAASLDYESTLSNVASLAVPYFADWCTVDIIAEDRSIQRLAIAHRDPSKVELGWELNRRYPQNLDASNGVPRVLRIGQAEIATEIPDEGLVAVAQDAEHLRILRELGLKSCIVVPLIARGRTLGAITFISAESGRRYSAAHLSLAEDLACRAAIAIDNARLYREARRSQQAALAAADRTARLQAVTAALSESLTPPQVACVIVEQSVAALGASSALVALLSEDGTELEILSAVGYEPDLVEAWHRFPVTAPVPLSEAVRTGEPVWSHSTADRVRNYPHLAHIYHRYNYGAWISLPLMLEGRALGGMLLSFSETQQLSQDDRAFILALAQQCAQALERARLYEAERTARAVSEAALSAAEAANRVKDQFLAIVSHELRTPLNAILGWSQMLRNRKLDAATTARALEIIERNARSQNQLIEDLLDVSRIMRGKVRLNTRPVDLVSVIEAAIEAVRLSAEAKNIRVETRLDFSASPVLGDSERLQQVVWNLLSNAIKFTPEGGRIEVWLQRCGLDAQIQVIDTGCGIGADFLPHVFEYFRQADGTITRSHGGLGLGLAIVRHLVELHGGTVQAESQGKNQGATFTVKLPLLEGSRKALDLGSRGSSRVPAQGTTHWAPLILSGLRILVVDDETDARDFLSFMLEQYGAEVTAAASAQEALQILEQLHPDVLVSDIGMPREDGYTLIRKVRALESEQGGKIPAIALTAYAREEDRRQAIAAGFQMHISKPVEAVDFAQAIANLTKQMGNATN